MLSRPWRLRYVVLCVWFAFLLPSGTASADDLAPARDHWERGELTAAILLLKQRLAEAFDDIDARLLLASVYLDLHQAEAAEQELLKAQSAGAPRSRLVVALARSWLLREQYASVLDQVAIESVSDPAAQAKLAALRGDAHRALGNHRAARDAYERALSLEPDQLDARLGEARLALAARKTDEARETLIAVTERNPEAARAWELLAELDFALGDYASAEQSLVKAVIVGRNKWMPRFKRALTRLELGKIAAAEADLDAVAEQFPNFPGLLLARGALALQRGELEAGVAALDAYRKLDPGNLRVLYLLAIGEIQRDNLDLAENHLRKYLELLPDSVLANRALAELLLLKQHPSAAEDLLRRALLAQPDDPDLLLSLVRALGRQRQWREAQEVVDALVSVAPDVADYRVVAAENLHRIGEPDAALEQLERALALDPLQRTAPLLQIKILLSEGRSRQALDLAERLARARRDDHHVLNALGLALLRAGSKSDAKSAFSAALEKDPTYPDAALNLARLAVNDGDPRGARRVLEDVVAAAPGHVEAILALAELDAAGDDRRGQQRRLREAMDAYPEEPRFRLALARSFLQSGSPDQAHRVLQAAPTRLRRQPELMLASGKAQVAIGELDMAVATFRALQQMTPDSARPYLLLAATHAKRGSVRAMEDALISGAAMAPQSPLLGPVLELALSQYKGAAQRFALVERLLDATDQSPPLVALQADLLADQGDFRRAEQLVQALYERYPDDIGVMRKLVEVQRAGNITEHAAAVLVDWLERHPDDGAARVMLAQLRVEMGQPDAGQALLEDLLASNAAHRSNPLILNNLAWLLRESEPERALGYAERALRADPDSAAVKDTLGFLLVKTGDLQRGLALLKEASRAAPADATIGYHYALGLAEAARDAEARVVLLNLMTKDFPERADAEALLRRLDD
jgi:putative PEP-CTERM system TPR-repeat lipoprotein